MGCERYLPTYAVLKQTPDSADGTSYRELTCAKIKTLSSAADFMRRTMVSVLKLLIILTWTGNMQTILHIACTPCPYYTSRVNSRFLLVQSPSSDIPQNMV